MRMRWFFSILAVMAVSIAALPARAATVPFVEDFTADSANWYNADSSAVLDWVASGGPDGGSFAQTTFNFVSTPTGTDTTILRAQANLGSSGGAFAGDYLTEGVAEFKIYVRHNAPEPLTFFMRFAGPANFPGAGAVNFAPVPPNTWTQISIPIIASNPQFVTFEGSDFNTVFSSIANLQLGLSTPASLGGVDSDITFQVDKAELVAGTPVPATSEWGLIAMTLVGCIGGTVVFRRVLA